MPASNDPGQDQAKTIRAETELQKRTLYIKALQRNYECISNAYKKLTTELEAAKQELARTKQDVNVTADHEEQRSQLLQTIERSSAENLGLAQDLAAVRGALATASANLQTSRDHLAQFGAQNQRLETEIAKLNATAQESRALISAANQKLRENACLIDKKKRIQDSMHNQISQLNVKIDEQEKQIRKLEIDLQKANNVSYRTGIDRDNLKSEISRIRQECACVVTEHRATSRLLEQCQDGNKGLALQVKALKAKTEPEQFNRVLEQTLATRQAAYDRCDKLSEVVDVLREEQVNLQHEISELRASGKTSMKKIAELKEACAEHEQSIIGLANAKEELMVCLNKLQKAKLEKQEQDILSRENEYLKCTIDEIENQRKVWMDDVRGIFGDNAGQQKLFQELQEINARLHASQDQLRAEIAAISEERDQLHQTTVLVVKRNEKLEEQLQHLHNHMLQMRQDFEHDSLQLRQELESTVSSLRQQLGDQKKDVEHVRRRNMELLTQDRLSPAEVKSIRQRETELNATVSKLVLAEESSEPAYTCMDCMKPFTDPVTCIPCGHSACEPCIIRAGICIQCGDKRRVSYYPNRLLAELSAKHVYRKQALAGLLQMSQQFLEKQDEVLV